MIYTQMLVEQDRLLKINLLGKLVEVHSQNMIGLLNMEKLALLTMRIVK
jgi:hypothetical protein